MHIFVNNFYLIAVPFNQNYNDMLLLLNNIFLSVVITKLVIN